MQMNVFHCLKFKNFVLSVQFCNQIQIFSIICAIVLTVFVDCVVLG